jgi:hypothetical protein
MEKDPPFLSSRMAAKTLGESKAGKQYQSMDPFIPTRAAVRMLPMTP